MLFTGSFLFLFISSTLLYYYYCIHTTATTVVAANDIIAKDSIGDWIWKQKNTSFHLMLNNINPAGTKRGFFAASLSTENPDYFYTWTRDAALVARVLVSLPDTHDSLLTDYLEFQIDTQSEPTLCECLGEPKFNTDGTAYMGSWGRPQNDGPAERAIAFILIAQRLISHGNSHYVRNTVLPAILKDVEYVVEVWQEPCFDLWEEVNGNHFYTLMVMRRALLDTLDFLDQLDHPRPDEYVKTVKALESRIQTFWSASQNYIMATQNVRNGVHKPSGLDVSTLIAANLLANRNDGFFTPGSDKMLATAYHLEQVFKSLYPLNQNTNAGQLGTSIGRYPEDVYDGYGTSRGNPWFIATATFTELYYLAMKEWRQKGLVINDVNRPFFQRILSNEHIAVNTFYTPGSLELDQIMYKTSKFADQFLATIQYHQHRNGSMSEQFDRYIGYMAGARDLTWSHAAVLSAIKAREGTLFV